MQAKLLPLIPLLVLSTSGCFGPQTSPGDLGYVIDATNHYYATRYLDVLVTDNMTEPGHPHAVRTIANMQQKPEISNGASFGCPEPESRHDGANPLFAVKIVMKDQKTYVPVDGYAQDSHVLSIKKWTGLQCSRIDKGSNFQLVIDAQDEMHLYRGYQPNPPYKDPMQEVAA